MTNRRRMMELNRILNEGMQTRGSIDNSIWSIDVPVDGRGKVTNTVKKIAELGKAADKLELDWILWGIGNWEADGEPIFGTPLLILKGKTLYWEDKSSGNKLLKALPELGSSKIAFTLYGRR